MRCSRIRCYVALRSVGVESTVVLLHFFFQIENKNQHGSTVCT
jgi:hypothetical protein